MDLEIILNDGLVPFEFELAGQVCRGMARPNAWTPEVEARLISLGRAADERGKDGGVELDQLRLAGTPSEELAACLCGVGADAPYEARSAASAGLLGSWDLNRAGEPIGTDFNSLRRTPTVILSAALVAIQRAMSPNSKSAATSGAGSARKGR